MTDDKVAACFALGFFVVCALAVAVAVIREIMRGD